MSVLVATRLHLRRTYKKEQLSAPADSFGVGIFGMSHTAPTGQLILADNYSSSVKALDIATGTVRLIYMETEHEWEVSNVLLVVAANGTQTLLVAESHKSNLKSKRLLVADMDKWCTIRERRKITWIDDTAVRFNWGAS